MKRGSVSGITLIEMLVVLVLIALIGSLVGPVVSRQLDAIALQTTATELAARLRQAQAVARADQVPVTMTYSDHLVRFWKKGTSVAVYSLPVSISPVAPDLMAYLFLPSGQIIGPDRLELHNERGRKIAIKTDLFSGISVSLGSLPSLGATQSRNY